MWDLDIKKAEHWRIDAFELWCWRRLLRVPWTARRSNQSILKEISPEYIHWKDWCWSWSSNDLATWCEELTHCKRPWCWERLKARGEGDDRGWAGITNSIGMRLSKLLEMVKDREGCHAIVHGVPTVGHDWVTELTDRLWGNSKSLYKRLKRYINQLDIWGSFLSRLKLWKEQMILETN